MSSKHICEAIRVLDKHWQGVVTEIVFRCVNTFIKTAATDFVIYFDQSACHLLRLLVSRSRSFLTMLMNLSLDGQNRFYQNCP